MDLLELQNIAWRYLVDYLASALINVVPTELTLRDFMSQACMSRIRSHYDLGCIMTAHSGLSCNIQVL